MSELRPLEFCIDSDLADTLSQFLGLEESRLLLGMTPVIITTGKPSFLLKEDVRRLKESKISIVEPPYRIYISASNTERVEHYRYAGFPRRVLDDADSFSENVLSYVRQQVVGDENL